MCLGLIALWLAFTIWMLARFGTLAAGKQADIVLVLGNPNNDIRDFEKVEMVIKDGVTMTPRRFSMT